VKNEKYHSSLRFNWIRLQRVVLRGIIRPLVRWQPLENPLPGYTVIIGAQAGLSQLVDVNLRFLAQQVHDDLQQVIIVFDRPADRIDPPVEARLRARYPKLPLRFIYYSPRQARILDRINWGWCYSWLSWSLGIAATQTRYALLHDLDAMLIAPDLLQRQYQAITQRGDQYVGVKYYKGNGVLPDDQLVTTFELIFDAQFVRQHFRPIDLFNHVCRHRGRRVEFDTFLYAQSQRGTTSITQVQSEEMVHPSQLICQVTELRREGEYTAPVVNNLPMLPYFFFLAGDEQALSHHQAVFDAASDTRVAFLGHTMNASRLTADHVDWLELQVERLERAIVGDVRPQVRDYFQSLRAFAQRNNTDTPIAATSVAMHHD